MGGSVLEKTFVCVCVCVGQKGLRGIGRLDCPAESFSTGSGETHGKSLLHIFSSHESENGDRANAAY